MRVKKTFSGCAVTLAGAVVPAPPPPVNVVREKLAFTRMFLLRYQFKPDRPGLRRRGRCGRIGEDRESGIVNVQFRITRDHLPRAPPPFRGSNGCLGVTPL